MNLPLVLLDVDGVLNPWRRSSLDWRRYTGIVDGVPYRILLDPRHGPRLIALAHECGAELAWATTWEDQANDEISPRIGLRRRLPSRSRRCQVRPHRRPSHAGSDLAAAPAVSRM